MSNQDLGFFIVLMFIWILALPYALGAGLLFLFGFIGYQAALINAGIAALTWLSISQLLTH